MLPQKFRFLAIQKPGDELLSFLMQQIGGWLVDIFQLGSQLVDPAL
jgi:hypothetical protein